MAEKKSTKNRQSKANQKTPIVKPKEEVQLRESNNEVKEIMNKILLCLYAIIVILIVNTTIVLLKDAKFGTASTGESETQGSAEYDVSMFTSVTADTLGEKVSGETAKLVYIGRDSCGYCVKFLPVLQQAQEDYDYETLYLDITTVTTTEQQDKILAFDNDEKFLEENFGGTPMVLLMKDGKLVDEWIGYADYATYAAWLEENGFAKK